MIAGCGALLLALAVPAQEAGAPETADDPPGGAFVEVLPAVTEAWPGQEVEVTVRFGFDAAWREATLVPLFRRPLDVPVQVRPEAWQELEGVRLLPVDADAAEPGDADAAGPGGSDLSSAAPARSWSFAWGDELGRATRSEEMRAGRAVEVFTHRARLRLRTPGAVALPPLVLRYAHATSFRTDFLGNRVAEGEARHEVTSSARTLTVRAFPEAGRPDDFTGAVGRYALTTTLDAEAPGLPDDAFRVRYRVTGDGELATLELPAWPPPPGFHALGRLDAGMRDGAREVVHDYVLTDPSRRAFPERALPYFAPGPPPAYRVARSAALPLPTRVRQAAAAASHSAAPSSGAAPAGLGGRRILGLGWGMRTFIIVLGALLLLSGGLLWRRMRRHAAEQEERKPWAERHTGQAASRTDRVGGLRGLPERGMEGWMPPTTATPPEVGDAVRDLQLHLAHRLRCAPASLFDDGLTNRLERAGAEAELAERTAALLRRVTEARYQAPDPPHQHEPEVPGDQDGTGLEARLQRLEPEAAELLAAWKGLPEPAAAASRGGAE